MTSEKIEALCCLAHEAVKEIINGSMASSWEQVSCGEKRGVIDKVALQLMEAAAPGASEEIRARLLASLLNSLEPFLLKPLPRVTSFAQLKAFAARQSKPMETFYYRGLPLRYLHDNCFMVLADDGLLELTPDLLLLTGLEDDRVMLVQSAPDES